MPAECQHSRGGGGSELKRGFSNLAQTRSGWGSCKQQSFRAEFTHADKLRRLSSDSGYIITVISSTSTGESEMLSLRIGEDKGKPHYKVNNYEMV